MDNQMNEPTLIDRDILKRVVDEVMQESSKIDNELNNFTVCAADFKDGDEIDEDQKLILNDAVVRNEMFTDIWGRSLYSALTDITYTSLPHFAVIQKCLIYILNSEALHFGIAKTLLTKLLFFHPPHTPAMETYYWHILTDKYVTLEYESRESENIFFTVIKCLSASLENPVLIKDKENQILGVRDYWSTERDSTTAVNYTVRLYYKHLPVSKQFDRALLVFEFLYEILQMNFVHHMKKNTVHTQRDRCLLSRLFWSRVADVGIISPSLKRLQKLFVLMGIPSENHIGQTHKKFMVLLAEFYKNIDSDKNFNPFYKNKKCYLASQLSLKLYKGLKNQFATQGVKYLRMVRPHWLRFKISCKWLGYITCIYCPGELSSVCEVLKLLKTLITKKRLYRGIYDVRSRNRGRNGPDDEEASSSRPDMRYCSINCVFMKRNKSKKMKMSPAETKEPDCYGWAPLHMAILLGHQKCVEDIVNFTGESQPEEAIETRIPGYKWFAPLLCALIKEQGKVCNLLMDHSGHGLFEDINMSSDTPFDVFDDRDIGRIINSGARSSSKPEIWKKFHFTPTDVPLVTEICQILVESYFVTYRIPDVVSRLKAYQSHSSDSDKKTDEESKELNNDLEEANTNVDANNSEKAKELNNDLEGASTSADANNSEKSKELNNDLEGASTSADANNSEKPKELNNDLEGASTSADANNSEKPKELNNGLEGASTSADANNSEEPKELNNGLEGASTSADANNSEEPKEWDYDRYEKDISENLEKLCEMMTQYADKIEIKNALHPLNTFLHDVTEN